MPEQSDNGLVYHIDVELLRKAKERALRADIEKVEARIYETKQDLEIIKTAENALGKIQEELRQMSILASESAENPSANRAKLSRRFDAHKLNIDKIVASACYNGVNLLDGSMGSINNIIAALKKTLK